jgi:hypothetical protein
MWLLSGANPRDRRSDEPEGQGRGAERSTNVTDTVSVSPPKTGWDGRGRWLGLFSPLYEIPIGGCLAPPSRSSANHLVVRASQLTPSGRASGAAL